MTSQLRIRSDDLTWQEVDEEIVVLDLASSTYLALNGSGALLWKRLVTGASSAELADLLVTEFDIPVRVARDDVDGFISRCAGLGLVE